MTVSLPVGKKRFITPYRVGVSVLLAAAAAALYIGFVSSVDHKTESASVKPALVNAVQPEPDSSAVLRQTRIFARLQPGYTGALIVDGIEIPDDQVDHLEGVNTLGYTPGPGTETGALKPGPRCATVVYWPVGRTRASSSDSYRWCWQVH
jgi:hypothetical protein